MKLTRNMSLTKKFIIGIGIIIIFFWALLSYITYISLRDIYISEVFKKTDMLFTHIQSTMTFIRKDLRPQMFHVLPVDQFIKEAMSVSFITKEIMKNFREEYPRIVYKRVSSDPMNPENRANPHEKEYIESFNRERNKEFWKGIIIKEKSKYAFHVKPIVMEEECLSCHGSPADAPKVLTDSYGTQHGFNKKLGDIIGIEYISIPLDNTFLQIKEVVMYIFLIGIVGVVLMFVSLNSLINFLAIRPLKKASGFFKSVVHGDKGLDTKFSVTSRDEIGELSHSFNLMMDYLKTSQEKLINSEKKYRQIFEGSQDAIIVADSQGILQEINQAGTKLLGYTNNSEVINSYTISDMFSDKKDHNEFLRLMEVNGYSKDFETKLLKTDGTVIDVLLSANFREDEKKDISGYEIIIKDITERKKLIQQISEAERLAATGQLAAGVAHEINNPLSIIIGYTGLLLEDNALKGSSRRDLQTIYKNAQSCKKIIDDLLDFSRKAETTLECCDIGALIDSVIEMLRYELEKKNINIMKEFDNKTPPVCIDTDKIKQVFMNILINAFQAVGNNGSIRVRTYSLTESDIVRIAITDNGYGIEDEIKEKIFEPFFTTKPIGEGTGLGLSVSYGIIHEHGGKIFAEKNTPRGTTIYIELPLTTSVKEKA